MSFIEKYMKRRKQIWSNIGLLSSMKKWLHGFFSAFYMAGALGCVGVWYFWVDNYVLLWAACVSLLFGIYQLYQMVKLHRMGAKGFVTELKKYAEDVKSESDESESKDRPNVP